MLHHINDLRNVVEHRYEKPPALLRCRELVELAWYFLKSTDGLSTSISTHISLGDDECEGSREPWLALYFDPQHDWRCSVDGWMPLGLLHDQENDQTMTVRVEKLESATQFRRRVRNFISAGDVDSAVRGDVYFSGEMNLSGTVTEKLIQLYFSNA